MASIVGAGTTVRTVSRFAVLTFVVAIAGCGQSAVSSASAVQSASTAPSPTPSPAYDGPDELELGDCFQPIEDKDDRTLLAAAVLPCEAPHLEEVIGVGQLAGPPGAPWPGDPEASREAEELCQAAFTAYVGIDYERSKLEAAFIYPTEKTWPGGDRVVLCTVEAHPSQPFTSSVRGTKQ